MNKPFILLIGCLFLGGTIFAANPDDGDNMYVFTKGVSQATVYSLDNLDKLTFSSTAMSVWTNNGKKDYAFSGISLVTFRETMKPTGVEMLMNDDNSVQISYDREAQVVHVVSAKSLTSVQVCDLQGRIVAKVGKTSNDVRLSLAGLPNGIYIVRSFGDGYGKSMKLIK